MGRDDMVEFAGETAEKWTALDIEKKEHGFLVWAHEECKFQQTTAETIRTHHANHHVEHVQLSSRSPTRCRISGGDFESAHSSVTLPGRCFSVFFSK